MAIPCETRSRPHHRPARRIALGPSMGRQAAPRRATAWKPLPEEFAAWPSEGFVSGRRLGKQGVAHRPLMGLAAGGTHDAHLVLSDAQERADLARDAAVDR